MFRSSGLLPGQWEGFVSYQARSRMHWFSRTAFLILHTAGEHTKKPVPCILIDESKPNSLKVLEELSTGKDDKQKNSTSPANQLLTYWVMSMSRRKSQCCSNRPPPHFTLKLFRLSCHCLLQPSLTCRCASASPSAVHPSPCLQLMSPFAASS